ncbi:hypothetical protein [Terracidiphilus sp.]|jgi:hypothetical protein|uniref:hypothetical protein n=1 Tax=Terracidiphilus sp. TaxID=1964191 RepID=UPI003C161573
MPQVSVQYKIFLSEGNHRQPRNASYILESNPPSKENVTGQGIIGGVAVDGGGSILINGVPQPVDPWGPLTVSLVRSSLVTAGCAAAAPQLAAAGRRLAAAAALESIRAALPAIEREAAGCE